MAEQPEHADGRRLPGRGTCMHYPSIYKRNENIQADFLISCENTVLRRILLLHRRLGLLALPPQWLQRARQVRGLGAWDLLGAWDAGHQFDREDPSERRQLLVFWHGGRVEGQIRAVSRVRIDGGRVGGFGGM